MVTKVNATVIDATNASVSYATTAGTATLATKASTLSQSGGNGTAMTFNWAGQAGQPTWLWGSNDGSNIYVWNPSNFSVNYATSAGSASNAIGVGQTWQDVIGSRSAGVTYTNSTGKSIMVGIRTQGGAYITVSGVITSYSGINNASNYLGTIVPNGASYYMTGTVYNWAELR